MTDDLKKCSTCLVQKSLDAFHKDANRPGGRRAACKSCRAVRYASPSLATNKETRPGRNIDYRGSGIELLDPEGVLVRPEHCTKIPSERTMKRFWEYVTRRRDGCWDFRAEAPGLMKFRVNYGHYGNGLVRVLLAHRFMAELTLNRWLWEGEIVYQACGNDKCVNPYHLSVTALTPLIELSPEEI